jgi:hypothetical protein
MWKYLGVVAAASLLAMVSPLLAASDGGLLRPDTDVLMAALALLVLAGQFLLIYVLLMPHSGDGR